MPSRSVPEKTLPNPITASGSSIDPPTNVDGIVIIFATYATVCANRAVQVQCCDFERPFRMQPSVPVGLTASARPAAGYPGAMQRIPRRKRHRTHSQLARAAVRQQTQRMVPTAPALAAKAGRAAAPARPATRSYRQRTASQSIVTVHCCR
jgi:hypothetical protein